VKRILFLIARLNGGGAERALSNITLAMPDDIQIDILVNCEEPEKDYPHRGNVISVTRLDNKKIRVPYPIRVFCGRFIKLKELKKKGHYNACISFMDEPNIVNILTGNKYCKVILSERTTLSKINSKKYRHRIKPLARLLYKKADKIVAVSKGVEDDLNNNFDIMKEKLVTIYNGYDVSMIKKQAGEKVNLGFDKECFYFLNTGRIDSSKAQWHLIRAFSKVVQKHSECRLIICGQGPYKGMLENIVLVNGLQEKVIFLGFVKNPYAVSKQCDVFVFPSMHEGMPNALIENMICGLPVIATDFRSGAREILAPDTDYRYQIKDTVEVSEYGILTPVCSGNKKLVSEDLEREEKLLADAMLRLVEDSSMRMHYSEQSKKRARDFEIQKQVEQWLSILDGEN